MRTTALLIGAALWCAAGTASAQSANLAEAKKRMTEAKALYGKGDFEQSRLKYVEACSIARTDNCVRSLAVAELAAGRPADAYVHFQEVARGVGAARLGPQATKDLNELIQDAYAKCGHVEVSAPSGTLLAVDERSAGAVPSEAIAVEPGVHTFEAQRGDRHKRVTQDAPAGKIVRVVFAEEDLAGAPAVVVAPVGPIGAPVNPGNPTPSVDVEAQSRTWPPVGAWILGGVGLAGIGFGVAFTVLGNSKNDDVVAANQAGACANASSSACTTEHSSKDAVTRDRVIEGVGYGVGGLGLVGAVVWSLAAPKSSAPVAFVPDLGHGHAGLRLSLSF